MVPIILWTSSGSIAVDALIDSGADRSLFHTSIALELGIAPESGEPGFFTGIEAGRVQAWLHEVEVEVYGIKQNTKLVVGFVDTPGVSAILGQDGFFDAYRIKFEKDHDTFEIKPAK